MLVLVVVVDKLQVLLVLLDMLLLVQIILVVEDMEKQKQLLEQALDY